MSGTSGVWRVGILALAVLLPRAAALAEDQPGDRTARLAAVKLNLRSPVPATVAQAAYAAGTHDLREVVTDLTQVLAERAKPTRREDWLVVKHLLDALVRLDAKVPMADLARFEDDIKTTVLVLAMRSGPDAFPLLRKTLQRDGEGQQVGALAVASGNALVAHRDPGVAALNLSRIAPLIKVTVVDHDRLSLGGGESHTSGHGDGWCEVPEGFPPYVWYELGFRESSVVESHLLVRGPTHDVWYERWENPSKKFILGFLSDKGDATETGLGWTAALLGTNVENLRLKRRYYATHRWVDEEGFAAFVAKQLENVQLDATSVLGSLKDARLLTQADRDAVVIRPRFVVSDDRDNRDVPIPSPDSTRR